MVCNEIGWYNNLIIHILNSPIIIKQRMFCTMAVTLRLRCILFTYYVLVKITLW